MRRVRASRALARIIVGDGDMMLCAHVHRRRHWAEPWLDALFFVAYLGQRGHCALNAAWEARQAREPDLLDLWREAGLL